MGKITAMSLIKIESKKSAESLAELKKVKQIKNIIFLTGEFDGILEIEVDTMEELYQAFFDNIDKIEGIKETNTHVVMKKFILQ